MPDIILPYPGRDLTLRLAEGRLGEVAAPRPVRSPADPADAIADALENPIGSPRLENIIRPGSRVAVVIDDITRETPTALLLQHLLPRLHAAGAARENICILVALGTHRPMTPVEIRKKVGARVAAAYRVINASCDDKALFCDLGRSSGGIPVRVHRAVADAECRIGLGMIIPHLDCGFGGGAKIILPGLCGRDTIAALHNRMIRVQDNPLGRADAELRMELEAFVQENVPLSFILNVIPDRRGRVYRAVAGHPIAAHRAGVRHAMAVYGVPVSRRYPLVISNAHPHHVDFWQASKALASGELMTADGGSLILVGACPEEMGDHPLFGRYTGMAPQALRREIALNRAKDPVAAAEALAVGRIRQRIRLVLVSDGIGAVRAGEMGMGYYADVEAAIAGELARRPNARIGILTHGGALVPMCESRSPESGKTDLQFARTEQARHGIRHSG